jgi:predicted transposase YbfD/YdcC
VQVAKQKALHLVSAFATTSRLVLGQEAVDEKSNEITAIPALLKRLDLEGALVSIDAMGCNPTIAPVDARCQDRLPSGRQGQPADAACRHQKLFRHSTLRRGRAVRDPRGKEHGRIEVRAHTVSHVVDFVSATPIAASPPGANAQSSARTLSIKQP